MSPFEFSQGAAQQLLALGRLFLRTREVLRDHLASDGQLAHDEVGYLAQDTLPYVEAMQAGLRSTLRASEAGAEELRYVVGPWRYQPDDTDLPAGEPSLRPADMTCVLALRHGRVVMGLLPRLPRELSTYRDGLPYRDIRPPRGPGELKERLEELERGVWEVATGRRPHDIYHGRYRRLYGFFDVGAWLGLEQARLFGHLPS